MRVLLFGYHLAGYRALSALVARGHEVLVATHDPAPGVPDVRSLSEHLGVKVVNDDPEKIYSIALRFEPQVAFSLYYRHVVPSKIIELCELGAYNFHPSLLPLHRGCFSAPWAIMEGDLVTGVTCHEMTEQLDGGGIVDTLEVNITDRDTGLSLYDKQSDAAVRLFDLILERIEEGPLTSHPQQGEGSFHTRQVPYDGVINTTWPRDRIKRFIRALHFPPHQPATVELDGNAHPVRTFAEYDELLARLSEPALTG